MKRITVVLLAGIWGLIPASVGAARHPRRNQVARREHHQTTRIKQGVKSGELTKDEAQKLRSEEKGIREERKEMMSDGHLTKEEQHKLNQDLNKTSKDIYEEKHDAEMK